jgi:hypothetical protein
MRPRVTRIAAVVLGTAAATAGLTACAKPTPDVTIQTGATSSVIKPQTYCFDLSHCRLSNNPTTAIKAKAGATLLVDVPRQVSTHTWSVTSASQNADGKTLSAIQLDGASVPSIVNSHSARVVVPYGTGQYYLIVTQANGSPNPSSWISRVQVSN